MNLYYCLSVSILVFFTGICLPLSWAWVLFPWQRPFLKTTYKPSAKSLNHLDTLIKLLAEVHSWFGPRNSPIAPGLHNTLWEHINYLKIEQDSCTVIFSPKSDDRIWALRRLSQTKTQRVMAIIRIISEHNSASEDVRALAKKILREHAKSPQKSKRPNRPKYQKHSMSENNNEKNSVIYSENTVIHMEEGSMVKKDGDTYNVGQAGAAGPNAHAHHFQIMQNTENELKKMDLTALSNELEILRSELKKLAQTAEHDAAVGAIADAEVEIKQGNIVKAGENLKKAGIWAFDVATKIGIGLAIAALKTSLGL